MAPPTQNYYADGPDESAAGGTYFLVPTNADYPETDMNLLFNLEPSTIPKVGLKRKKGFGIDFHLF